MRGNTRMAGYYKNPEATAEAGLHGWHHTGDIGVKDDAGFIYIVDRKKDMIISGGFNVFPSEVEQVIWTHPAVQDCAVVGAPDEKWGEAVTAVVELKPGTSVEPEELLALCRARLGGVKAPKAVHIWPELPRSNVGKVLKREIRARFWEGTQRSI
jgi:acyl-CoA synthetase (AMP-forming)/AMP-acid ligase II